MSDPSELHNVSVDIRLNVNGDVSPSWSSSFSNWSDDAVYDDEDGDANEDVKVECAYQIRPLK